MANKYNNFTILISKISRIIKNIQENEMKQINLKTQHLSCLYYLFINKKMMAKDIVENYYEDKGQVSRALDYLENNSYIECESKAKKRYNAYYFLTEKGKAIAEYIGKQIDSFVSKACEGLAEEERSVMYKCLNAISQNLLS